MALQSSILGGKQMMYVPRNPTLADGDKDYQRREQGDDSTAKFLEGHRDQNKTLLPEKIAWAF